MAVQYDSANGWTTWLDMFKKKIPEISKEASSLFDKLNTNVEFKGYDNKQILAYAQGLDIADESLISFLRTKSEKATLPCSFSPSNQIIPKIEMPTSGGAIIISYFSFMFHLTNQSFLNQFNMVL